MSKPKVVPGSQALHPGERTNFEGKPIRNQILLAIPDEEFHALRQDLQYIELPQRTILHEPRQKLEFVHFLNSGMVSLVFRTRNGDSVEVGVLGNEGFTPIPVAAGLRSSPHQAIMQISGEGFRLEAQPIAKSFELQWAAAKRAQPLRSGARHASGADSGLQPAA